MLGGIVTAKFVEYDVVDGELVTLLSTLEQPESVHAITVSEPGTCVLTVAPIVVEFVVGGSTMYGTLTLMFVGFAHVTCIGTVTEPTVTLLYTNDKLSVHDGLLDEQP
jgi:hypothetical protein